MNFRELKSIEEALKWAADPLTRFHFSQFGEDVIFWSLLQTYGRLDKPGFYVDLGGYHPVYLSNTMMLRLLGWRGMNVDANAKTIQLFRGMRPEDINVQAVISDVEEDVEFTYYDQSGVGTADSKMVNHHAQTGLFQIIGRETVRTSRLEKLFETHLPEGQAIDLMTIDLEGNDYKALLSNDWERFAPWILAIEDHEMNLVRSRPASPIWAFLETKGYRLSSHAFATSIYVRDQL